MSSWRPLVEVLDEVDHGAPGLIQGAGEGSQEGAQGNQDAAPVYGRQQARGRVQTHTFPPSPEDNAQHRAEVEAESVRRSAYQEGMALARQESEALALRYRESIESLGHIKEQVVRSCEQDLVRLALIIAREVLMADVSGREHFTQRMVEQALTLLGDVQTMTLRLAPQDLAAMRKHKPELMRRQGLNWVEDVAIAMGGVVVEADRGKLDASIESRLQAMAQTLLSDAPSSVL